MIFALVVAVILSGKTEQFIIIKAKVSVKTADTNSLMNNTKKTITQTQKNLIDKLLLEKISLRGIKRVVGVSWRWLQNYVNNKLAKVLRTINVSDKPRGKITILLRRVMVICKL